jgi:hypothetical protein
MMFRYLPWKFVIQRAARAYGLADPALWLARIRSFAQPSEVAEPIELLRAGILFHARGVVNTKAIQHNLDWIWPYWVERQFDPEDVSFIPRGFAISHVNLTHRNWTAIGLPSLSIYPIVDPRGLVTPLVDGWSIDCWLLDAEGKALVPSRLHDRSVRQRLVSEQQLAVVTAAQEGELQLVQSASVATSGGEAQVQIAIEATSPRGGRLVVAIRPYNPEGVQFIDRIDELPGRAGWTVNDRIEVRFDRPAQRLLASDYASGDVYRLIGQAASAAGEEAQPGHIRCKVGMATAAAEFPLTAGRADLTVTVPLAKELALLGNPKSFDPSLTWTRACSGVAELKVPDERIKFLYDSAVRTLVLLSADEIVPGPYTYRRFWFRDACLMMNALIAIGLAGRCGRILAGFPARQLTSGYFRSQDGEWDSNGQVLWILDRYLALTGERLSDAWLRAVGKAVQWIDRKRVRNGDDSFHAGLLPAGFSAEHLGPNDHYYWDDFWSEAGLRAAGRIYERLGRGDEARRATALAEDLRQAIDRSIARLPAWRSLAGIPASPYRRIDAGAVGSLVADYPLQLYPPGAPLVMATVEALLAKCFLRGGFFQDVIHSGLNAYLTLDIAQTLLRAGDQRFRGLVETVTGLASPTGQWPEAIHPLTGGGCMGDGQHGWAAAEWVMMIRNLFVREEDDRLIIGSGLFREWLETEGELSLGPTLTWWGPVTMRLDNPARKAALSVESRWFADAPRIEVLIPGFQPVSQFNGEARIALSRLASAESQEPRAAAAARPAP